MTRKPSIVRRLLHVRAEWRRSLERLTELEQTLAGLSDFVFAMNHDVRLDLVDVREETAVLVQQQSAWLRKRLSIDIDELRAEAIDLVRGEAQACEARAGELTEAVRAHAQRHAEELVEQTRAEILNRLAALHRSIDSVRLPSAGAPADAIDRVVVGASARSIDPSLYPAFEDRFRGSSEVIRARQERYVPYVRDVVDSEHPLADLGPGRGEWLDLLRDRGVSAFGVEENPVFVKVTTEQELDVREGDLVAFLRSVETGTLGAVTMFQVVEHLPVSILLDVFRDVLAALRPGGVFIAETPNALNLTVAASSFWLDPSHIVPIHPALLQFLAETVGFADIELVFSNPIDAEYPDVALPGPADDLLRRVHASLFGARDVTLIARAPT